MENDIKSCPFCGGKANIFIDNGAYKKYSVFCSNNNCCRTPNFSYRYLAIKLWNRRTAPAGMVPLEWEKLSLFLFRELHICDIETSGHMAKAICKKFASPQREIPSVEDIAKILFKFNYPYYDQNGYQWDALKESYIEKAQYIRDLMYGKERE